MQPSIGVVTNERKSAGRSIKDLIAEVHTLLDKLDDGIEGLIDDDRFIEGWFTIRKIRGRHKAKEKSAKESAKNKIESSYGSSLTALFVHRGVAFFTDRLPIRPQSGIYFRI